MPSASAANTEHATRTRGDGVVVCNHKLPRGRCNKLMLTESGELRCPNGHLTPITDVLYEALNRPDARLCVLQKCLPSGFDLRPLIRRLSSPEFLSASKDSPYYNFLINRLDIFCEILAHADLFEPECAKALRDYWENKLPEFWPEIGRCLRMLKEIDTLNYISFRERALLAFRRWGYHDPLRYMVWSELSLEALRHLGVKHDKYAALYRHNIEETGRLLQSGNRFPTPALLYFQRHQGDEVAFMVIPDPYWSHNGWGLDQIYVCIRKESSMGRMLNIKFSTTNHDLMPKLEKRIANFALGEFGGDDITYSGGHGRQVSAVLPPKMRFDFAEPESHLKVVQELVSVLFLHMELVAD